jgi:hypothetical protein
LLVFFCPAVCILNYYLGLAIAASCFIFFCFSNRHEIAISQPDGSLQARNESNRQAHVDSFRAIIMSLVCFCILAVDFPVFPRVFAKTEETGISLMDLGVGAMMFSAALVWKVRHVQGMHISPPLHVRLFHDTHADRDR